MCIIWQCIRRKLYLGLLLADLQSAFDIVNRHSLTRMLGDGPIGKVGHNLVRVYESMEVFISTAQGWSEGYKVAGGSCKGKA